MLKTISFDPNGKKLYANASITGLVIGSYQLRLYSSRADNEKVIQEELGNNRQPHDDTFWLCNQSNKNEPISNHHDRYVELMANVNTDKQEVSYKIVLTVYQGDPSNKDNVLDTVVFSDTLSSNDGGKLRGVGAILTTK